MENRWNRHLEMAKIVRKWVADNGFEMFPEAGHESVTLSCVKNTRNIDIKALNKELSKRHHCVISSGYGDIKDTTFRIAHMADTTVQEIKDLLVWMEAIMAEMNAPVPA